MLHNITWYYMILHHIAYLYSMPQDDGTRVIYHYLGLATQPVRRWPPTTSTVPSIIVIAAWLMPRELRCDSYHEGLFRNPENVVCLQTANIHIPQYIYILYIIVANKICRNDLIKNQCDIRICLDMEVNPNI